MNVFIKKFGTPWDTHTEKKFLEKLITDLNSNLLAGRDKEPNLSRSAKRPAMYTALRAGAIEKAVFVGGSHASNLAYAASALGLDAYKIATGGWKLSKENVDKVLPDDGFHVRGALVVAPEKAMKYFLEQLKRISVECGSHLVFVLTPWLRFVRQPCCDDAGHVTNFGDPDFLLSLLSDLTKLKFQIRKAVAPAVMVDSLELICGSGYGQEKVAQTISMGWAVDPVHPNKHIYAKAALHLMEKMANNKPAAPSGGLPPSQKRTWSTSNESGSQGPSSRSGGNGGGDGGRGAGNSGGYSGNSGGGSRKSSRSQQWQEMRRWTAPGYQRSEGFQRDRREYSGGGGSSGRRDGYGPPSYPREYGGGNYRGNYRGNGGYDRRYN